MTLLALDLGQTIGWIKGGIVGPLAHGEFPLAKTTKLGPWLRSGDKFFRAVLPGVTAIAVEQPFLGKSYWPARKLIGLLGMVAYWADWHGISDIEEIPIASGKINLSGKGNADAEEMIAAAERRYSMTLGEHEAHALGIFDVWQHGRVKTQAQQAAERRASLKGRSVL